MTNIENPKNPKKFACIHCNYMTSSKKTMRNIYSHVNIKYEQ